MPGPMVDVRVIRLMYEPLADAGRAFLMASIRAARLSYSCSLVKDAFPIGTCRLAVLSTRNSTRPALDSLITRGRSSAGTTVPALGLGTHPGGPRPRPRRPHFRHRT